jgi:hypothetical protein
MIVRMSKQPIIEDEPLTPELGRAFENAGRNLPRMTESSSPVSEAQSIQSRSRPLLDSRETTVEWW